MPVPSSTNTNNLWCSAIDKKGRQYYYHKLTREVSWHKPTEMLTEFSSPTQRSFVSKAEDNTNTSCSFVRHAPQQQHHRATSGTTPDVQAARSRLSLLKRKTASDENLSNNYQQQTNAQQQAFQTEQGPAQHAHHAHSHHAQPAQENSAHPPSQMDPNMGVPAAIAPQIPCDMCGRTFNARALVIHQRSCAKIKKKREIFNMAKQRSTHLETNGTSSSSSSSSSSFSSSSSSSSSSSRTNSRKQTRPKVPKWKGQSNALRRAMQAGRNHGKGTNSGSNGATFTAGDGDESNEAAAFVDDGLVPCPHCHRRFNQKAADRHIPKCLTIKAKPKTLKRGGGSSASNSNAAKETKEATARAAAEGTKWARPAGSSRKNARHGSKRPSTAASSSISTSATVKNMPVVSVADQSRAGRKAANTECPHCSRVFSAGVASRHIPKCAGIKAKPKAIKRSNERSGVKQQQQQRPPSAPAHARRNLRAPPVEQQHQAVEYDPKRHRLRQRGGARMQRRERQQEQPTRKHHRETGETRHTRDIPRERHQHQAPEQHHHQQQEPHGRRTMAAWDEQKEQRQQMEQEMLDELPSELDQLHAIGDRKFGAPGRRSGASRGGGRDNNGWRDRTGVPPVLSVSLVATEDDGAAEAAAAAAVAEQEAMTAKITRLKSELDELDQMLYGKKKKGKRTGR